MQPVFLAALVGIAVFAASWIGTGLVRRWLVARAILDRPVERSSHTTPVPRGAGLALVPALAAGALALSLAGAAPPGTMPIIVVALALGLVSWCDDVRSLPIVARLAAHAVAVAIGLAAWQEGAVFQGVLPPFVDRAAAGLLWLWFINLYNFMDGIDGITGVETAALGIGTALVLMVAGASNDGTAFVAIAAAAVALGFLRWNWHPAAIFLGDVGSVPLGFVLGWLLLLLAGRGLWAAALILPLYYLADASITLARRIKRREPFWRAHREHFYQRALAGDGDHAAVARRIAAGNFVLVLLAMLSVAQPLTALGLAVLAVAALLALLERRAGHGG
jgi:UDP-N-acetylmuramyl pentapeptide phosphotransferase/UDP-N-acetylglucosamine-1-phosphate transferase